MVDTGDNFKFVKHSQFHVYFTVEIDDYNHLEESNINIKKSLSLVACFF